MLEHYRVVVRLRDDAVAVGYSPVVDGNRGVIRWAESPEGGLVRTVPISAALMLVLTRPTSEAPRLWPPGDPVTVRFADGSKITGETRPVRMEGGIWLRPESAESDDMLIFVPEGAAQVAVFKASSPARAWSAVDDWRTTGSRPSLPDGVRAEVAVSEVPMDPPTPSPSGIAVVDIGLDETLDESGVFEWTHERD